MKISVIAARYNKVAKASRCNQEKGLSVKGYCSGAGGLSDRPRGCGQHPDRGSERGSFPRQGAGHRTRRPHSGHARFDSNNLQLVKDVTQVLYQMAVAVKVAVGL